MNQDFQSHQVIDYRQLKGAISAGMGDFYPSGIAEHYLKMSFSAGDIMLYCFRRFGYPAWPWDDYKQVAEWIVTTPMKGLFLRIEPRDYSPFGYVCQPKLGQQIEKEFLKEHRRWAKRFRKWAVTTKGITPVEFFSWGGDCTDDEVDLAFRKWLIRTWNLKSLDGIETMQDLSKELGISEEEITDKFYEDKTQEYELLCDEFEKTDPLPTDYMRVHQFPYRSHETSNCFISRLYHLRHSLFNNNFRKLSHLLSYFLNIYERKQNENFYKIPFWEALPENSLIRKCNKALYIAIQDLLRPTNIRDCYINICGTVKNIHRYVKYDDEDNPILDLTVPFSKHAGHGVDPELIGNPRWAKLKNRLMTNNYRSLIKRLERLAAIEKKYK